jgi:WD40 repeat protein
MQLLTVLAQKVPLDVTPHKREKCNLEGISCVGPVEKSGSGIKFMSGGHDHTVRLWTVSSDTYTSKVDLLHDHHSSLVHALAYTPKGQLVSASNCTVVLYDIAKGKKLDIRPSSNTIYRVHVQPNQPDVLATEVSFPMVLFPSVTEHQPKVKHLDRQINIYDLRKGFLRGPPVVDMGYRDEGSTCASRYQCGAFKGSLFVRGYLDGTIKLFDIRNPKVTGLVTAWHSLSDH